MKKLGLITLFAAVSMAVVGCGGTSGTKVTPTKFKEEVDSVLTIDTAVETRSYMMAGCVVKYSYSRTYKNMEGTNYSAKGSMEFVFNNSTVKLEAKEEADQGKEEYGFLENFINDESLFDYWGENMTVEEIEEMGQNGTSFYIKPFRTSFDYEYDYKYQSVKEKASVTFNNTGLPISASEDMTIKESGTGAVQTGKISMSVKWNTPKEA